MDWWMKALNMHGFYFSGTLDVDSSVLVKTLLSVEDVSLISQHLIKSIRREGCSCQRQRPHIFLGFLKTLVSLDSSSGNSTWMLEVKFTIVSSASAGYTLEMLEGAM